MTFCSFTHIFACNGIGIDAFVTPHKGMLKNKTISRVLMYNYPTYYASGQKWVEIRTNVRGHIFWRDSITCNFRISRQRYEPLQVLKVFLSNFYPLTFSGLTQADGKYLP